MQDSHSAAVILKAMLIINELQRQIANLTDERDEARRMYRGQQVNKYKWEELIGKRLLLTDTITRNQRNEWTLLELNSNGRIGKFRNELDDTCFWTDLDYFVVMNVLSPNKEDGK